MHRNARARRRPRCMIRDRPIGLWLPGARLMFVALCIAGAVSALPSRGLAGSARDYLNAPIDSWLAFYNSGYAASVTPENGLDITAPIRTNVVLQSLALTRTMDFWGRTGGLTIVLPYVAVESSAASGVSAVRGLSDISFLWQINVNHR